jgi:hypothetical protein
MGFSDDAGDNGHGGDEQEEGKNRTGQSPFPLPFNIQNSTSKIH